MGCAHPAARTARVLGFSLLMFRNGGVPHSWLRIFPKELSSTPSTATGAVTSLPGNPGFSWSCHLPPDLAVEIGKGNPAKFSFDLGFDLGPGSPEVLIWWPCRIRGVWSLGKWLIKGMKPPGVGMCEFPQFCFAYFALIALPGVGGHKLLSRGWKMVIPVVNNEKKWNFEEEQSLGNTMEAMLRRKGRAPKCQGEHKIFPKIWEKQWRKDKPKKEINKLNLKELFPSPKLGCPNPSLLPGPRGEAPARAVQQLLSEAHSCCLAHSSSLAPAASSHHSGGCRPLADFLDVRADLPLPLRVSKHCSVKIWCQKKKI